MYPKTVHPPPNIVKTIVKGCQSVSCGIWLRDIGTGGLFIVPCHPKKSLTGRGFEEFVGQVKALIMFLIGPVKMLGK